MSFSDDERHIFAAMRRRRIVFVRDPLDSDEANRVIAELLHLEERGPLDEVTLRVSTRRAEPRAALAVYDTMMAMLSPLATVCAGVAAGGAVLLVAAGAPGRRSALPSAQFLLEPVVERLQGHPGNVAAQAQRLAALQAHFTTLLARHTGQPEPRIQDDTDRRLALGAEEARAYGLIDRIAGPATDRARP
ncbi:MAG TPA: ATP-dependent Clp protease proteolytic subunit [bacterium]|nr:ATP-dependent Clp protease proteolytic subunit [bacterium]